MVKVLVFGTFDGLHKGHKDFFRQAKEYGNYLVVVVGRDSTVQIVKNRLPKFNESERLVQVKNSKFIDEARLGNEATDPYRIIKEINPNIICLGYNQTHFTDKLAQKLKEMDLGNIQVKRLTAYKPDQFHSSLLNK